MNRPSVELNAMIGLLDAVLHCLAPDAILAPSPRPPSCLRLVRGHQIASMY